MGCEIVICLIFGIIFLHFLMQLHSEDFYQDEDE